MSVLNKRQEPEAPLMLIKVVFVGDVGVGKTSLLSREYDDSFTTQHLATIGVDFRVKNYDLGLFKVKAQMWDTAGQERFRSIQKPYYKNAKAVCVCFSLADRKSFVNLDKWIDELISFDVPRESVFLIGCKSDLDIEVPTDEIILYAQQKDMIYHETSSLNGDGVHQAFQNLMIKCAQRQIQASALRNKQNKEPQLQLALVQQKKALIKKSCC